MVASLMDPDIDGGMINKQIDGTIITLPLSCYVCLFYNPGLGFLGIWMQPLDKTTDMEENLGTSTVC